jgi:CRISPR-associated endonuclease Csn1
MRYGIGLDIGITSIGFAITELDDADKPIRLARLGARIFDAAENPKDGASLALPRREARSARRRLRRRRHRRERIKYLFASEYLLGHTESENLFSGELSDVYKLRVDALDRALSNAELARVLLHLAQRRGFKSNRKTDAKDKEEGALLGAISQNQALMTERGYRTVGELLYKDERFAAYKRNKSENYQNTVTRDMVTDEARAIFAAQRAFGSEFCRAEIEEKYIDILTSQRSFDEGPGAGHEKSPSPYSGDQIDKMVGYCTFEPDEKRAAKATYSFEYFNLLQKVNHLRLVDERGNAVPLNAEQRNKLIDFAHKTEKPDYAKIRKELAIPASQTFNAVRYRGDADRDEMEKKEKLAVMRAYHEMRKAFDKIAKGRITSVSTEQRDEIGRLFTIYKSESKLRPCLTALGLSGIEIDTLLTLPNFSGFGHLSLKAITKINAQLERGVNYDEACTAAGYEFKGHTGDERERFIVPKLLAEAMVNTITSPVVKRAVSQTAKVVNAIIREMGESPVYVNIELAREMSHDFDERREIEKSQEENRAKNERIMDRIRDDFGRQNPTGFDLVKLRLYEEQSGVCPYSLRQIDVTRLFEPGYVDVDHIVPYSISFDDTNKNKVLVLTEENRQKGNRLPLEYLSGKRRDDYIVWVNCANFNFRKKKLLLKEHLTDEDINGFKERNLQDTKTISRFLYNYLTDNLAFAPSNINRKRRVTAVNGAVTSVMRKRWGLTKIREDGDLHHALDAAVIACTTDGMIQSAKAFYHNKEIAYAQIEGEAFAVDERTGEVLDFRKFPLPWKHFTDELEALLSDDPERILRDLKLPTYSEAEYETARPVFVSRMPRRKTTGAAHKETIKSAATIDDGYVLKKVPLTALKLDKDGEIADYYNPSSDVLLYDALRARLLAHGNDAKKAFAEPFYKPKSDGTSGPLVKKVKIEEKSTLAVPVHGGTAVADNDSMVRVDVFHIDGDGYYLVPIYTADTVKAELPNRAIVAYKPHAEWKVMSDEDFLFSLYPNDLVCVKKKSPFEFSKVQKESRLPDKLIKDSARVEVFVYYKSTGIAVGSISVITHNNAYSIPSLGVKTLLSLEKCTVDPLGNISRVGHEPRLGFGGTEED